MVDFDSLPDDNAAVQPAAATQPQSAGPSFDDLQDDSDKYGTTLETVKAGLEGMAQGVAGPLATGAELEAGVDPEGMRGRAQTTAHSVGELGGFLGSALTGVGEAAALGGVGDAAKTVTGLGQVAESSPLLHKIAAEGISQAAEMAVLTGGDEVSKMMIQDPDATAETAMSNIGLSAALGGAGGMFMAGAVSPLWKATLGPKLESALKSISMDHASDITGATPDQTMRPIIKKALAVLGGTDEKAIDEYLANHSAIQSSPEFSDVYEHAMDHVGKISDDLEEGKLTHTEAKSRFKELETQMKQDLQLKGADARQADGMAQYALKDAQSKLADDIQTKALDSGKQITQAVETLRQNIVDQSAEAYNVLDKSDAKIDLKPIFSKAEQLAKELEGYSTPESMAQANRLRTYAENLKEQFQPVKETPDERFIRLNSGAPSPVQDALISGPQAKQLIQGLDKLSTYDFNATAFDKGLNSSYKQLRHTLDSGLKEAVPEYMRAMKPLAEDTGLLAELKKYGTEESATRAVNGLKKEVAFKNEWPLLKSLEERTGHAFTKDIEPFADSELREKLMKSLPEYAEAEKTANALATLKDPRTGMAMQEALARSEEARFLAEAEAKLQAAKTAKADISGITPSTLQGKLKTASVAGKNIALEQALANIPGLQGKSLPEMLNLIRMREAFLKNATRGSKHVNLYGAIIGGISGLLRHGAELGGVGLGAVTGATVDSFGPQMVQKALDKYMNHFGKISELANEGEKTAASKLMGNILGANMGNPSADGFKAGVDYISATMRGESKLAKATEAVFKGGVNQLIVNRPTDADRSKLDKLVTQYQAQPNAQMASIQNSKVGHYLPDHGVSLAKAGTQAVQYLQNLKPHAHQISPLDTPIQPTAAEVSRYHRALDIAQNPLLVLQKAKDGTISPDDIQDLHGMYPALYNRISAKISNSMISKVSAQEPIPYKTKMGVSLLLGQPLDSTMSPNNIMAAQPMPVPPVQQQMPKGNKTTSKLGKTNKSYMTVTQNAENDRSSRE